MKHGAKDFLQSPKQKIYYCIRTWKRLYNNLNLCKCQWTVASTMKENQIEIRHHNLRAKRKNRNNLQQR